MRVRSSPDENDVECRAAGTTAVLSGACMASGSARKQDIRRPNLLLTLT